MKITKPTVKLWPIDKLAGHPRNYRHHPQDQIDAIKASLRRFGWAKASISARPSDGLIWTGHGVTEAARQLGLSQVPVVERELTDSEGLAWLAADNELSREGLVVDDGAALAGILSELAELDEGLAGTGHDAESLAELLAQLDDDLGCLELDTEPCDAGEGGEAHKGGQAGESGEASPAGEGEIQRHKAAITRAQLSAPIALLDGLGYLDGTKSLFDYGCGKGDDLRELGARGVKAAGFDPHFAPHAGLERADLVNLGFVLNVIEDQAERAEVLREAFDLADELLIVGVMIGKAPEHQAPFGDGVRTSTGTFQRYYSQSEITAYVTDTLASDAVAVVSMGGGLVLAFPTKVAHAAFLRRQADTAATFDDDPALDLVEKWGVREGQIWQLGEHRLHVGDVLIPGVVEHLIELDKLGPVDAVITDPPFAIYGSSTGIGADISDDRMVRPFFELALGRMRDSVKWFGHVYVSCDWRSWGGIWESARRVRLSPANCLVWDRGNGGLGSMYSNCHELVGFFIKTPPPSAMRSTSARGHRMVYKPNILRHNRAHGAERLHNAAKPLALVTELIEASTDSGQRVLDPFCGSGSTLIACERTGRVCYTADAEPRWVATTLQRWADETGRTPELAKG